MGIKCRRTCLLNKLQSNSLTTRIGNAELNQAGPKCAQCPAASLVSPIRQFW